MTTSEKDKETSGKRLLIVDDDPLIRLVARERLSAEGYDVVDAESGRDGVEAFAEQPANLILLDVEMPELDGYEVCRAIRASPHGSYVPILILTGRDDIESIERAYESGATDFVMKPINWVILARRVRYMLRASESFLAVRSQQLRLDEVQLHAKLGSWEIDPSTCLMTCSAAFRGLIGLQEPQEQLPIDRILEVVPANDRRSLEEVALTAVANGDGFSLEHRVRGPNGEELIVHTQARARMSADDECVALEGFSQDITERRRTEQQVRTLAFTDSLTGLANRVAFKSHLENSIRRARRTGRGLGVLYFDLDQFKRVNDTFGHTAGDRLLCIVADALNSCLYECSVSTDMLISRLGGDEFTVLLDDMNDPGQVSSIAHRVLHALARPVFVEGHEIRITASIGIALYPHDGDNAEILLRNADSAMYRAKDLGRANFQYYRRELNSHALERLELEASLSRAIARDSLLVHFQPKLDVATGRISGCEALARWSDSRAGLVAPSAFVPLAESSGLISGLGESILRKACLGAKRWQWGRNAEFKLAVNLSPGQIQDEDVVARIDAVLRETGFDPSLLEFEITESALIQDERRTLKVLQELQSRGCRISLDDLGTGYSSLSNLKRFPVQTLKIDRSFVSGIGSSREDEAITAAILSMAQNMGIRVVAEGIETEEQLEFLVERKCDEIQGFLISRPLDADLFAAFLGEYNR